MYKTTPVERSFVPSWELYLSILIPARSDFRLARFFSSLLRTELTNPALCPFAVLEETTKVLKITTAIRPKGINLFINTP
jgi:hypothetical protein